MSNGSGSGGSNDKDKTVIGGSFDDLFGAMGIPRPTLLPGQPPPQPTAQLPFGQAAPPAGPFAANPFPASAPGFLGQPSGVPPPAGPFGQPSPVPGSVGSGDWSAPGMPAFSAAPPTIGGGIGQPGTNQAASLFAGASSPPSQPAQPGEPVHKIELAVALAAKGFPPGALKNPLVAQAAKLLILFGRLRMQVVAMEAIPLISHVAQEIEIFETTLGRAGMDAHEVRIGKYLLSATADDIVQNLPGTDRHLWLQYSMTARFFNDRTSGTGFFHEIDKLLAVPAQGFRLLELALLCLSLGFEGRFRSEPNGGVALQRYRGAIYESLRRVEARPDEDISLRWQPVVKGGKLKMGGAWVLALAGLLAAGLVGGYIGLRTFLSTESEAVAAVLLTPKPAGPITLVRSPDVVVAPPVTPAEQPKTEQFDRLNLALADEIAAGKVKVSRKGNYINIILTSESLPFASGKADVSADFDALATKLGTMIDVEKGQVKIIGYTDNVPLRSTNKFKNNQDLSTARATSVLKSLSSHVADPTRLLADGRGEEDPIGDNKTEDGQRQNRRVEIWVLREEMLG